MNTNRWLGFAHGQFYHMILFMNVWQKNLDSTFRKRKQETKKNGVNKCFDTVCLPLQYKKSSKNYTNCCTD